MATTRVVEWVGPALDVPELATIVATVVLIGVDTIPDMFRTMANVTGWLGGGAIPARARSPSAYRAPCRRTRAA